MSEGKIGYTDTKRANLLVTLFRYLPELPVSQLPSSWKLVLFLNLRLNFKVNHFEIQGDSKRWTQFRRSILVFQN